MTFWWQNDRHDVLPIVMGARPEDYASSAPHHSYIHVVGHHQLHWYQQHDHHNYLYQWSSNFIDISMIIITNCINGLPNNSSWSPNWNNQDEFAGPKELADYLLKLDKDDEAYNQYFKWKVSRLSIRLSTLVFCVELLRPSYWLTWEPLSESLYHIMLLIWQKTKDICVIKRT